MVGPYSVTDDAPGKPEALDPGKVCDVQHEDELPCRLGSSNLTKPPGELGDYYMLARRTEKDLATLRDMDAFLPVLADSMGAECIRSQVNLAGAALREIGGLRMAASAEDGAVDPHGHFHHIENLSVADAAAWPSQGSANSYLTIVAWSLCHADEVIKRLARA